MLTERRQQQAICDLLKGAQPTLSHDQLTPPYDYLWEVVMVNLPDKYLAIEALITARQENPDLSSIIDAVIELKPNQSPHYETLAYIGPNLPQVTWYWPNWVPRGLLTVLAADAGVGKTNVALDLARRNITGLPAPDGVPLDIRSGNIIYVDAEGFLPVIYDRLASWNMDLSRFYPVQRPERDMLDLGLKRNQDHLIDMCYDLRPDLLTIDSLSTISSKGENNVEDTRELLNFLANLANHFSLALLLVHHLRKPPANGQNSGAGPVSQHDLRGSGHLSYMARSILGLYIPGLDPNGPRRLHMVKTNLCKHPRPLVMNYIPAPDNPDVLTLTYEVSEKPLIPDTLTGDCAMWLLDMLSEGPMSYFDLRAAAVEAGYNETMLQEARRKLDWQVIDTHGVKRKGNKWAVYQSEDDETGDENHMASHGSNGSHGKIIRTIIDEPLESPELTPKTPDFISRFDKKGPSHGHMAHVIDPPPEILPPPLSHGPCEPCDVMRNNRRSHNAISRQNPLSRRRTNRRPGSLAAPPHRRNRSHLSRLPGALLVNHAQPVAQRMVPKGPGRPATARRINSPWKRGRSL
ncbi:MAG: AAA family ATPase [Anaerolineales bacterium]|nr:AAA family ATPase [Anaerolineales bacterium]